MALHIHIHSRDTWEESKHPRDSDGKFGTGKTAPKSAAQAMTSKHSVAHGGLPRDAIMGISASEDTPATRAILARWEALKKGQR